MKKIFLILLLFLSINFANGDVPSLTGYYYQFHLYYNNGVLVNDRDFKYSYDVIPGLYIQSGVQTAYPYVIEIISISGVKLTEVEFDPGVQLTGKTVGKLTVTAPYFANAKDVNIYDSQNKILISIPVSETSFCNDDKICDSDVGENYNNCPNDCTSSSLLAVTPSPSATAVPETDKTSSLLSAILYILGGLAIAGGYFGWRWYQKRNFNNT
ncbi:MAG: hypothetical protein UT43_C0018G0004 [Parcubacteria group bacterium GW2011_GWC1_39_29]|uniref:Uncharacterized protein n=1 Tax=Candidatus Yanofskybacteria bacterium GW2011_GWD1_39_16 TaxID=1619030 RepID=A0A837HQH5_9BACT|nr:MAG: hypothetical protein UT35_C0013G0003 [Candidatus Yanofskybacteria bacterium GW2011_GWD1_39_16]KKR14706.1 MAG: hypothetical protein UT43_C0018G0004 [Parcubacteria group bacterium GW2011_GWC1_39_29]